MADSAGGWTDDCPERHRLPCRGGGSQQPETVSARGVAGPHARRDGALDADAGLPCEKVMHRGWAYVQARLAFTMAAFNVLVQWHGFQPNASGFVPLSIAEFSL